MNTVILLLSISFFLLGAYIPASADTGYSAENETSSESVDALKPVFSVDSIYAYDEKNVPQVFFFPKEKARWDGSRVTMSEWYTLTELQKETFIIEYFNQVQRERKVTLDVMGTDYLKALNVFSEYADKRTMNEPSTKFIDILLSGQGKISGRDQSTPGAHK